MVLEAIARTVDLVLSVIGSQGQDSRGGITLDLLHSYCSSSQLTSSLTMSFGPQTLELSLTLLFLSCWLCFRMECVSGHIASPHPRHLSQSHVPPELWQNCLPSTLYSSIHQGKCHCISCTATYMHLPGRKNRSRGERTILCGQQKDFFQRKRTKGKSKSKKLRYKTSKSEMVVIM